MLFSDLTELTANIHEVKNFIEKKIRLITWHLNYGMPI